MPLSVLKYSTSITAIDQSIKQLYETGYMHNHLRMYTAGIFVILANIIGSNLLNGCITIY